MFKHLKKSSLILPILCLIMALGIACATTLAPGDQPIQESGSTLVIEHIPNKPGVVYAQGDVDAAIGELPTHLIPSTRGAGVEIDCGGTYPGLRGSYVSTITRTGTILAVVHQVPDDTALGKVRCDTNNISLAGAGADGVVSAGAFSSDLMNLNLTITTGGTDTTVTVPVPSGVRSGATLSDILPLDVLETGPSAGTSSEVSRVDHAHAGDRQRPFGSHTPANIAAAGSTGTNTTVLPSDHVHGGQRAFALSNPADVATGTGTVGVLDTLSRSDHTHGGDRDTQHTYGAGTPAVVVTGSGSAGSDTTVSRFDHQHGGDTDTQRSYESSNPTTVGADGQVAGTDADVSRGDHKHQLDTNQRLPINATQGQVAIWDNTNNVWIADDALTSQNLPVYVASAAASQTAQTFAFVATPTLGTSPRLGSTVVWKTPSTVSPVTNDPQINLSITGGPTGINVALADGTSLNVSELEDNAPYIVVWDGTLWRIPDPVVVGTGGTATSFTALTDTPNTYTNQERRIVRVNNQGTELEFVDEPPPSHAIQNFGRVPAATATSPDIIYVTHDYTAGARQDATMTVGFDSPFAGFSNGDDIPAFGSIDENSPVTSLLGTGTSTSYDITTLNSANEHWIDDVEFVYLGGTGYSLTSSYLDSGFFERTLISSPTGLTAATLALNFQFTDGSWYFTDSATDTFQGGLYEKVQTGSGEFIYVHISLGEQHVDGSLPPVDPPDFAGQLYVSDEGKLWVAGDEITTISSDPMITADSVFTNTYLLDAGSTCSATSSDGEFVTVNSGGFEQRQGSNCATVGWDDAWVYIVANVESTAALLALRDDSIYLGEYSINARQNAAEQRQHQVDATLQYFYVNAESNPHVVYRIDTFVGGNTQTTDHFFWRGFHLVGEDVYEIVNAVVDPNPSGVPVTDFLERIDLGLPAVTYRVGYTRPDSSGDLPDPTLVDFTHSQLAFDGTHEYGVRRSLVSGHSASATFTEVSENDAFGAGGNQYQWRTFHHHDNQVGSPVAFNFYFNFGCTCLRVYEAVGGGSPFWRDLPGNHPLASVLNLIPGLYSSQTDALAHVMTDGQRVAYAITNGHRLATVSSYVAPLAAHFEYSWEIIGGAEDVQANPSGSTSDNLYTLSVGGATYDVGSLIAADESGDLRDVRADDWDTGNGRSRVLAYDGRHFLWAERSLISGHGSSATYTEVPIGTAIEAWFWRGVHNMDDQAGSNPQDGWVYYNIFTERLRVWELINNRWSDIPANHVVPDEFNLVGFPHPGVFEGANLAESQANALAYVSANGQRFLAADGPVGTIRMYQVSGYVAATADQYAYDWIEAFPESLADAAPVNIGDTGSAGTSNDLAREDHTHELPTDNTLYWDDSDQLAVQISDVIEHLQENIRYYTDSTSYATNGSCAGAVYNTGPHTTTISKLTAEIDPPSGTHHYRARLYRVNSSDTIQSKLGESGNVEVTGSVGARTFRLDGLGVSVPTNDRIAVMICRTGAGDNADTLLREGSEASNSPNQSYTNAEDDFDFVHSIEYASPDPANGTGRKYQGNEIRGNIRLYYDLKYDHAALIGSGNVNASHIDSESAADGRVLTADGSGGSAWETCGLPAGGGVNDVLAKNSAADCDVHWSSGQGFVSQADVIDQIQLQVENYALNSQPGSRIPVSRFDAAQLLPINATDGQHAQWDATSMSWVAVDPPSGGGSSIQAVRVTPSANFTIAQDTNVALAWNSESFDDANFHDNVTNNTRLTIPANVDRVELTCGVSLNGPTGTVGFGLMIRENGSTAIVLHTDDRLHFDQPFGAGMMLSTGPIAVSAGDYFECVAHTTQAGGRSLLASSFFSLVTLD